MNILPTEDRIVVKPTEEEESIGNLKIERSHTYEVSIGIVVAAGPKAPFYDKRTKVGNFILDMCNKMIGIDKKPYEIGQKVMFSPGSGTLIRTLGSEGWEEFRIMHADVLQCVIDV